MAQKVLKQMSQGISPVKGKQAKDSGPDITARRSEEDRLGGDETILVIEDDGELRRVVKECLEQQGYQVFEGSQWSEASTLCAQMKEPIHLILTDVIMPEMSGPQMIERLQKIRNGFKVLYMSGYTDASIVHHGVLKEGIEFIQKPFTFRGLGKKVREVLDEGNRTSQSAQRLA